MQWQMISIQQMEVCLVVVIITTIIPTFKHECSASGCSLTGLQYSSHLTLGCDLVDSDGSLRKTLWTINLPFAFFCFLCQEMLQVFRDCLYKDYLAFLFSEGAGIASACNSKEKAFSCAFLCLSGTFLQISTLHSK